MLTPTTSTTQVSDSIAIKPLLAAMQFGNDKLPNNSLPIDTDGTIQENAEKAAVPEVTLYNAHGIVSRNKPNTLIAYA
jgi:hypothetical protein